jgi:serine-type D-Ala-D-Ala carboxypeptidase/endopeptidase
MHASRSIAFLATLLVALVASDRVAAADAQREAAIREAGRAWLSANDGIGLTLGIFENGERRFFNLGVTQVDSNKAPTKDTVYEIGGISKAFTGQLLARAIVEGRAALTDEAAKYLPEQYPNLANGSEKVRLVHLVNSTSQLLDNIPDLSQVRAVPGEPLAVTHMRVIEKYTPKEFLRQLHRVMPRLPPGSGPASSNVGAMLLGVVLEGIYGQPFDKVLAAEIEKPLRMASGAAPPAKLLARGYTEAGEALPGFGAPMQYATATLRYSADDLLKFCSWQMVERDASVKLAHQPTWSTPDGKVSLGFFWLTAESPQGRRLISTGSTYGFASVCDLYPDAKVTVVALANKNAAGAQESLRALTAHIVSVLRPAADEGTGVVSPRPSSAGAPPRGR